MASIFNLVRESVLAKIAVWLVDESRDMAGYGSLARQDGRIVYTRGGIEYAVVPKIGTQDYHTPGVNVVFLSFIDEATDRMTNKRWRLPVVVRVNRLLEVGDDPVVVDSEVIEIIERVIEALKDNRIEIRDFDTMELKGIATVDKDFGLQPEDESLAIEGGSIRHALTFHITFVNKS